MKWIAETKKMQHQASSPNNDCQKMTMLCWHPHAVIAECHVMYIGKSVYLRSKGSDMEITFSL